MTDDVYFGSLRDSLGQPENNSIIQSENNSLAQPENDFSFSQDHVAPMRPSHHGQRTIIEMIIGPWYLDEFGNPTREIKARE